MKKISILNIVFIFLPLMFGCTRSFNGNNYLIDIESRDYRYVPNKVEKSLKVRRFKGNRILSDTRIVYMENPVKVDYYDLHSWVMSLDHMVGDLFYEHIFDSGVFKNLYNYSDTYLTDYSVTGVINFIGEDTKNGDRFARTDMTLFIYDRDNNLIWRNRYEKFERIEFENDYNIFVNELVTTLSQQVSEVFKDFIEQAPSVIK